MREEEVVDVAVIAWDFVCDIYAFDTRFVRI